MTDTVFERVDLPSGGWINLRDPQDTTETQRRPAKRASMRATGVFTLVNDNPSAFSKLDDDQLDLLWSFSECVAVALIESWSFDLPITREGLSQVKGQKDYDTIIDATKKHQKVLMPDFGPSGDEADPTGLSADSDAIS